MATNKTPTNSSSSSRSAGKRELEVSSLSKKGFEELILSGDLSVLSPEEKGKYYVDLCRAIGLNPVIQPFLVIKLNGKELLYAGKRCCEQLRQLHGISITHLEQDIKGEFVITRVKGHNEKGRVDSDESVVVISGLTKADKANAIMKGVTKAKNRLTLSLAGLGMLDQSEIDTIPNAVPVSQIVINGTDTLEPEKKSSGASRKTTTNRSK